MTRRANRTSNRTVTSCAKARGCGFIPFAALAELRRSVGEVIQLRSRARSSRFVLTEVTPRSGDLILARLAWGAFDSPVSREEGASLLPMRV